MNSSRVDEIIKKHDGKASSLIQILLDIQRENHWLPQDVLEKVSDRLDIPMNQVLRTATFHKTFSLTPEGNHQIHVCNGTSCHVRGSQGVIDSVQDALGIKPGETDADYKFRLETFTCLGCCSSGPVMVVDGRHYEGMTPTKAEEVLKKLD
jgi:NADH-quinone oxidoreductase subunit E